MKAGTVSTVTQVAAVASAVGSGVVGGVFFAFSAFVMPALGRLPAPAGIAAMQSINRLAVTPPLMVALFGTAAACTVLAATARGRAPLALVGAVLYVLTAVVVTVTANVPLNDHLAALDPATAQAGAAWADYLHRWTWWNHVRTTGCIAACTLITIAHRTGAFR